MVKQKRILKKNNIGTFISICKKNILFILFILISFYLIFPKIKSFYEPIYFETKGFINSRDSIQKLQLCVDLKFETERAFLPNEKIKVTARLAIIDSIYKNKAEGERFIMMMLGGSEFTNNQMNEVNKIDQFHLPENAPVQTKLIKSFTVEHGNILMYPTDIKDEYYGEAEVIYRQQGTYSTALRFPFPEVQNLPFKFDIASSVELMNKKTNDLLYILTIINLLYLMYTKFKPNRK